MSATLDEYDDTDVPQEPAHRASGSLLGSLAARKAQLEAELTWEIGVPLWTEPTLRLVLKPLDHAYMQRAFARLEKVRGTSPGVSEAQLNANAAVLASAVVEVIVGDGDNAVSLPLASPAFVESLGLPEGSGGTAIIRAIALRDGDVIAMADDLVDRSGYKGDDIQEQFRGE